ncbi:LOW QUALITY PROTEIN: hypothetical protein PHMEG_0004000 [Phytophthora megakarya]|uniref:Uncharacterized protein n=1 Tax=Phytophthora megakarya TaxID=4795 RepID=A0A225WUV8_9STRA|nr:LOW QUALITY PROTEIN: hypothetical protein PHMEG_0004000 [Phytophthora megakarya]
MTCDFEKGLMNAVTEQFPLIKIVLRRKMIELRIPQDQIAAALSPGMVDVLTIIPVAEIAGKGIRFVRSRTTQTGSKAKWDAIWRYFLSTWTQTYSADLWDVNSMIEAGIDMHNRTNKTSYNRSFSNKFTVKHPGLVAFVEITKKESRRFVRLIDDVKNHRREPPPHAACVEPVIPSDYDEFE